MVRRSVADPLNFGTDPYLWLMDPDSDPDPVIFVSDHRGFNRKKSKFFFFKGTFTSFFIDKKSLKSHKTVEINVFLTIFAWCKKDPDPEPDLDPYLWLMDPKAYWSYRSWFGSGSATLVRRIRICIENADPDPKDLKSILFSKYLNSMSWPSLFKGCP